jgi:hypothetical protein
MNLRLPKTSLVALAISVVCIFLLAAPRQARADVLIGLDINGVAPLDANDLVSGGPGFNVRAGVEKHLPLLRVALEGGYGYARFSSDRAPADWTTQRVFGGARIGLGEVFVPFAFVHGGYGWRTSDSAYGGSGFAFDAGAGLDIRLWIVGFGGHIGYASIDAQPTAPKWIFAGLNGSLVF